MSRIFQIFRSDELHEILIEIAVIWLCVFLVVRFLKGTRGAGIVKGFAVLLVLVTITIKVLGQDRLNFIYDRFLGLLAILLIVVFQPELRQFMVRLGHARLFRGSSGRVNRVVEAVTEAAEFLSKSQVGALIAIERSVGLGGLIEGGERLDAEISGRLLGSIFWPNSPLHDLGVVIRSDRILAANVQFPLAEEGLVAREHGSRHRAAVGITLESDCLVVVVSEETGGIALVEQGVMETEIPIHQLRERLLNRLERQSSWTAAGKIKSADAPPDRATPGSAPGSASGSAPESAPGAGPPPEASAALAKEG